MQCQMTFEPFNPIFYFNIYVMESMWDIIRLSHLTYVHFQSFFIVRFIIQNLGCVVVFLKIHFWL